MQVPKLTPLTWAGLGLVALAYTLLYYHPMLGGTYRFNDDVAQHYLWLFAEYYDLPWQESMYARTSAVIQPWGVYAVMKVLGQFLPPLEVARYGVILLALVTAGYGTALLRRFMPLVLALAISLFTVHLSFAVTIGFLARAYMIPLLLVFAYYLLTEKPWGVAGALLAAALFYPPALILNLAILGVFELMNLLGYLFFGRGRRCSPPTPRRGELGQGAGDVATPPWRWWWIYGLTAVLTFGLAWAQAATVKAHPDLGNFLPRADLLGLPEFQAQGRVPVTNGMNTPVSFFVGYFANYYLRSPFAPWFEMAVPFLALVLGIVHRAKLGRLGRYLLVLTLCSAGLFYFAQLVFPLLFLPDRFMTYPWNMLATLVIGFLAAGVYHLLPRPWWAVVLALAVLAYANYQRTPAGLFGYGDLESELPLYNALAGLPPTAVIAAPPEIASWMPLMDHHLPFISNESAHLLYFEHYHPYVMTRFSDWASAITRPTGELADVVAFLDKYHIDYLVVDRDQLRRKYSGLWSPHREAYTVALDSARQSPALLGIPDSIGTLLPPHYHLLSRDDLESQLPSAQQ
ncbi:hypothetical protein QWY85_20040 [Neolewinella lacunae]|uniref:Uncharacterized protein n=1 Tax=Neolewinella lacunae TaxID=1517758 RepID=A0A923PRV3_9BACT|nr:hypothetical protein [Neolewinella lacunae]MBC6996349.1 hypothetical protein [Neolewinella lacunae]MDN3636972.1 hypothetical protein [Neolewinella lacunae]